MRGKRMTKLQKIFMVDYLEKNQELLHYNNSSLNAPSTETETKWRVLARDLNSPTLGPSKTTSQWKEAYKDFRSHTRRKCKMIESDPNTECRMTNIELRFLKLLNVDPPTNPTRETTKTSNKASEEQGYVTIVKVEKDIEFEDNDHDLSDEDPLVHLMKDNNGTASKRKIPSPVDKKDETDKEYIDWKRNKIEERLHFSSNASLALEMENHALQIQNLATSYEKNAQALMNLANSFEKVATAINNMADKLVKR